MSNILIYNAEGRILRSVSAPPDMLQMQIFENELGLEAPYADSEVSYILNETVTDRPTQPIVIDKTTLTADGVDTLTITGAVTNSTITVLGKFTKNRAFSETCSDPETFSTEIPDTYVLTISCFPYLDFTATIEAI